jgi:hypothetical protein
VTPRRSLRTIAPIALAAALAPGCVYDGSAVPVPGAAAPVLLHPGVPEVAIRWPSAFRRAAEYRIENRSGLAVESLLLDYGVLGENCELLEAVVTDPPGVPARILPAPHGTYPSRARLGEPGSVLLAPGAALTLRVRVWGEPSFFHARFSVPGVTRIDQGVEEIRSESGGAGRGRQGSSR